MTGWTPDELARIGRAEELEIASRRGDGIRPGLARPRPVGYRRRSTRFRAGVAERQTRSA
jgi:hypothetical protein